MPQYENLFLIDKYRGKVIDLDYLSLDEAKKNLLLQNLKNPSGLILFSGPVGSGKSVLYNASMNVINVPESSIKQIGGLDMLQKDGIQQACINPAKNDQLIEIIDSVFSQDADVFAVDDIYNNHVAKKIIDATDTGHLVLAQMFASDAVDAIRRFLNFGVSPDDILNTNVLIVSMKLLRKLCPDCKQEDESEKLLGTEHHFLQKELDGLTFYKSIGCENCDSGYRGRIPIYQLLTISDKMKSLFNDEDWVNKVNEHIKEEGILDLRSSGLKKVEEGITSISELIRVL